MDKRKRHSKGFRKWVRAEKARIRKSIHDIIEQEKAIEKLIATLPQKK